MAELKAILHKYQKSLSTGARLAVVTVLRVQGSSYRQPGARMLITDDGDIVGSVSGGCLERDLIRRAQKSFHEETSGRSGERFQVLTYDTTEEGEEHETLKSIALGCQGVVEMALEIVPRGARHKVLDALDASVNHRQTADLITVVSAPKSSAYTSGSYFLAEALETSDSLHALVKADFESLKGPLNKTYSQKEFSSGAISLLLERLHPPTRFIIFGSSHDAVPLAALAQFMGWHVTVVDCHSAYTMPERFFSEVDAYVKCAATEVSDKLKLDGAYCAVVTHNYFHDLEILKQLLPLDVPYIGLLGPKKKGDTILADLKAQSPNLNLKSLSRLFSPAGIDTGGEGPASVALSIITEALAVSTSRSGGFLRGRQTPIHNRELG